MYIKSLTKATPIREHQIDSNIQKLYFIIKTSLDVAGAANPLKTLTEQLANLKLSISKQTNEGNEPLILPIPIMEMAEICSNVEGHINVVHVTDAMDGFIVETECTVDLSNYGAVDLQNGFLLLTLDASTVFDDTITCEVYGIESPVKSPYYTEYKQLKVNADTLKSVSLVGKSTLSIPRAKFEQIDIVFPDRTVTYKKDIKAICQAVENVIGNFVSVDMGGIAANVKAQTYFDGINFYTIGVSQAIEAKILYSGDTKIIVTETKRV